MSNPQNAVVPSGFVRRNVTLIAALATAARVLVDATPAAAATATSPLYYGGASLIDLTAVNAASTQVNVQLWAAQIKTTAGGATGTLTAAASTLTRASGSFIADGFRVGQLVMIFADPAAAVEVNEGILCVITGVAALQLTFNGTPLTAGTVTAGARVCTVSPKFVVQLPASAGVSAAVPSVDMLHGNGNDGFADRAEFKLGATDLLAVSALAAVPALPAYVSVDAAVARY